MYKYNYQQQIANVMTDAVAGNGIRYWAEIDSASVKRNDEGDVVSFSLKDRETGIVTEIDEPTVLDALIIMLEIFSEINVHRSILSQFVGKEFDYDETGVDAVIQVAALGDVLYG